MRTFKDIRNDVMELRRGIDPNHFVVFFPPEDETLLIREAHIEAMQSPFKVGQKFCGLAAYMHTKLLVPKLVRADYIDSFIHHPYYGELHTFRLTYNINFQGVE